MAGVIITIVHGVGLKCMKIKDNKEHLEHLYQYITDRMRKLINDRKQLQHEFNKLSEYRTIVGELLNKEEE